MAVEGHMTHDMLTSRQALPLKAKAAARRIREKAMEAARKEMGWTRSG